MNTFREGLSVAAGVERGDEQPVVWGVIVDRWRTDRVVIALFSRKVLAML